MKMSIHSMFLAFVVLAVLISNGCAPTTPVPPHLHFHPYRPHSRQNQLRLQHNQTSQLLKLRETLNPHKISVARLFLT